MNNLSIAQVMSALQAGRLEQAAVLGDTLLQQLQAQQVSANDLADAYHLRGMVQRERGLLAEARADMRQASALEGDNAMLWLHIAQVEQRMQLADEAIASLRRAVALQPTLEEAWFTLGQMLYVKQDWREARQAFERLLALPAVSAPIEIITRNSLGVALRHLDELAASVMQFQRVLVLDEQQLEARLNLAQSLRLQQQGAQALAQIQHCVDAYPDSADAKLALAEMLAGQDAPAALRAMREAVRLQPEYRLRFARRLHHLERQLCDWNHFDDSVALCIQAARANTPEMGDLFTLLAVPGCDRTLLRQRADLWAQNILHEAQNAVPRSTDYSAKSHTRLRIGYLSADLHAHPTAWLMAEVFELHDRADFEIYAYSLGTDDGSAMRQRLQRAFDVFRDLRGMSLAQIDAQIRRDEIDILVDLKGYTEDARPEIMALRPAPVQVNYLGYPGTMGRGFVDYILADEIVLPPAHQADYGEQVIYLPHSYQCNDRQRAVASIPTRQEAGLPASGLVLSCFNSVYKLTPEWFKLWCELLHELPGSVLWLLDGGEHVRENLQRFAAAQGIPPERLIFARKLPHAEHLARLSLADLFLDTLPYNAHTTASDALWVGVPVITCLGDTFAGRVAASLLHAVGLDELICSTPQAYKALVIALAQNPQRLAALREHLQREKLRCALFDSPAFTRDLEQAYRSMWQAHHPKLDEQGRTEQEPIKQKQAEQPHVVLETEKTSRPWYVRWFKRA